MRNTPRYLFAALTLALTALAATAAHGYDEDYIPPDYGSSTPYIRYVSWCTSRAQVVAEDNKGALYVVRDCTKEQTDKRCVERSVRKGEVSWISGICTK